MKTPAAVSLAYHAIMRSEVFRTNGKPIDLPHALRLLGDACHAHKMSETVWSTLGEFTEAPLGDLIVGAYWSLTEWHAGQSSPEYAALCALGKVFSPGMSSLDEESPEYAAYEMINQWFQEKHPQ